MKPADLDLLVELLTRRQASDDSGQAWATVTATAPLRVRPDRADQSLDITPIDLVGNLRVGSRVRIGIINGQVYILGQPGGAAVTSAALTPLLTAGTPQYAPTVYRTQDGFVHVDGGITRAADAGLGTTEIPTGAYTAIGVLPAGYRPTKYQYYPAALPANAYPAGLRIQTTGVIEVIYGAGAPAAVVLPLTGIRFKAT